MACLKKGTVDDAMECEHMLLLLYDISCIKCALGMATARGKERLRPGDGATT